MISYCDKSLLLPCDWLIIHITTARAQQLNLRNSALYLGHVYFFFCISCVCAIIFYVLLHVFFGHLKPLLILKGCLMRKLCSRVLCKLFKGETIFQRVCSEYLLKTINVNPTTRNIFVFLIYYQIASRNWQHCLDHDSPTWRVSSLSPHYTLHVNIYIHTPFRTLRCTR